MPRKELLMAFANLMASKLSHEEIEIFCTAMLHANMLCKQKGVKSYAKEQSM